MIGNQTSGKPVIGSGNGSFVRFSTDELSGNNEQPFSTKQTALHDCSTQKFAAEPPRW